MAITLLDSITINKIAAGEVIERPLSVVKELVENSLDAGANRIRIVLENGGLDVIQVSDNGMGISKRDLPLSVLAHATSKIKAFDDLYAIHSFGFRGEALASMAHIADVTIESKEQGCEQAFFIKASPDAVSDPEMCALYEGTTITVEHLFSYVPVRKKQLKTPATEAAHALRYVEQLAFWYKDVDFEVILNGELRLSSVGINKRDLLCLKSLGIELKEFLIEIDKQPLAAGVDGVYLEGLMTVPTKTFPTRQKQFFAVNGRPTSHAVFRTAVKQVFGPLMPAGRHPLLYLNLIVPTADVDVNIHPRKLEVALHNQALLFKFLPGALRAHFASGYLQAEDLGACDGLKPENPRLQGASFAFQGGFLPSKGQSLQGEEMDVSQKTSVAYLTHQEPFFKAQEASLELESLFDEKSLSQDGDFTYLQVFNTYLVVASSRGLWILDQHAVHEKILYEQFCEKASQEKATQSVMSCVVDLSVNQAQILEEKRALFEALGLRFESMPSHQIQITQIPVLLYGIDLSQWLVTLLDALLAHPEKSVEIPKQKEALQMKACKAAIKAGKVLRSQEVKQLIKDFLRTPERFTCPHGRPLYQQFSKSKLERLFLRA